LGDTWYLDELFVAIRGRQQYLWRAVDRDAEDAAHRLRAVLVSMRFDEFVR